ncbi:HipA family kinase [Neisseria gonorrhoeae]
MIINCAFDTGFNPNNFLQNHIFSSAFRQILEDWVLREEMELWLKSALPAYRKACDNLPPEWAWANEERDLPAAYNRSRTDETVRRIDNGTLWSIS